jgi:Chitin synthase
VGEGRLEKGASEYIIRIFFLIGWFGPQVVVCIVSDGRAKINSRTLSVIAAMGAYQDGVAKNAVNGKPVTAHIYEYTSQSALVSLTFKPLF